MDGCTAGACTAGACPFTNRRAKSSSSCSRGAVAPDISRSADSTMSALRDSRRLPHFVAWVCMTTNWSAGVSTRMSDALSPAKAHTIKSRKRCSRSSTKRRGSWPVAMISSTILNAEAPSPSPSASTALSSMEASVYPSSSTAFSTVTTPSDPAMSWSSTDSESRTDPPPLRMMSGYTPSST